jgi:hypothetical protein
MTSDVAGARSLSPGAGEGQRLWWTRVWRSSERASHHTRALPALWPTLDGSERSTAYACRAIATSSVPTWLELDIWLARSLLRYAARNLSMENTVPRDNM